MPAVRVSLPPTVAHLGVTVRWWDRAESADLMLRRHVAEVTRVPFSSVGVGRLCRRCGSSAHGRPWATHGVHVSLARSGVHLVTAVSTSGEVGVDVEQVERVDAAWPELRAALDAPLVATGSARAAWWCRTEAVLKRDGVGFENWTSRSTVTAADVDDLVSPDGYCAALTHRQVAQVTGRGGSSRE